MKKFLFTAFLLIFLADITAGGVLKPRVANFYGINIKAGMSKDDLDFIAQYSLIVIGGYALQNASKAKSEWAYIKSKNPELLILLYISVRGMNPNEKGMRSELWFRTPDGQLVSPWKDRYLPNQTLPEVNNLIVAGARDMLTQIPHADGIFLDSFYRNISHMNKGQLDADGNGIKDDPQKLDKAWVDGLLRISRGIRAIKPNIIIMANGWAPLDFAYDELNGVLYEDQMICIEEVYSGKRKGSPIIADDLLTMYQKWQSVPNKPHVTAFVDGGNNFVNPWKWAKTSENKKGELINDAGNNVRRMRLNLCFALMGDGYAAFDYGTVARGQKWWFPEWDIKLGNPLGTMQKFDGYWRRQYEYAIVYVNPYPKSTQIQSGNEVLFLPSFDGKIVSQRSMER